MTAFFDITCVSRTSYGYSKRPSTRRLPALKGRPRYRLRDSWATYQVQVEWVFTQEQFEEFHTFWYDTIRAGVDPFEMQLMMDDQAYYGLGGEIYQVHAIEGFQATVDAHQMWTVRLPLEVAGGFRIGIVNCPIIWGGSLGGPPAEAPQILTPPTLIVGEYAPQILTPPTLSIVEIGNRTLVETYYYGGPIDNLATDIIAPCEGLLDGGN